MENQTNTQTSGNIDFKVRTYFLQQGKGIHTLYDTLNTGLIAGYLKRTASFVIEGLLWLFFLLLLFITIYIPLDPISIQQKLSEGERIEATYHNEDVTAAIWLIKTILFIAALMPAILALTLRRNRNKSQLIAKAFKQTEQLKVNFDNALKELKL